MGSGQIGSLGIHPNNGDRMARGLDIRLCIQALALGRQRCVSVPRAVDIQQDHAPGWVGVKLRRPCCLRAGTNIVPAACIEAHACVRAIAGGSCHTTDASCCIDLPCRDTT